MPTIYEFRLTLTWAESVLDTLASDVAVAGRPEVCDRASYAAYFQAASGERDDRELTVPWSLPGGQRFWRVYLEGGDSSLKNLSGQQAWHNLIPLRMHGPVSVEPPAGAAATASEALLYPWGPVVSITVYWREPLELERLAAAVVGARPAIVSRASAGLDAVRKKIYGAAPRDWRELEPFSISTAIRGEPAATGMDAGDEPVHRFLQAVCTFNSSWEDDGLPDLESRRVARRSAEPPEHIVYGTRRGRAVWSPSHFSRPPGRQMHTLGCRHRNLSIVSAHCESLAGFVHATAVKLSDGDQLSPAHRKLANRAVVKLAALRDGRSTYRSGSVARQMSDNGWLVDINAVRHYLGLDPLG